MCKVPKKPSRHPWPRALEDSRCTVTLLSVRVSCKLSRLELSPTQGKVHTLLIDSSSFGKSLLSMGYIPAKT
jgi:hypothetical protein